MQAEVLMMRLLAYEAAVKSLPGWMHPSWYRTFGLGGKPVLAGGAERFLAPALGVGVPAAEAFETAAHRVAVLPHGLLCRVLRARGLLRHRSALRLCLDDALRRRLAAWLHSAVIEAVLCEGGEVRSAESAGLPLPPLGQQGPADSLAWEGFCLFQRDGVWTDAALRRLVRLGFDADLHEPPDLHASPGTDGGSAWVLQRLNRFVPEAPWLCG